MEETKKKKLEMQQGKRYLGYGFLNEYREFCFEPVKEGSQRDRQNIIKAGDGWSVSTTGKKVVIHISFLKDSSTLELIKRFLKRVDYCIKVLKDYDI